MFEHLEGLLLENWNSADSFVMNFNSKVHMQDLTKIRNLSSSIMGFQTHKNINISQLYPKRISKGLFYFQSLSRHPYPDVTDMMYSTVNTTPFMLHVSLWLNVTHRWYHRRNSVWICNGVQQSHLMRTHEKEKQVNEYHWLSSKGHSQYRVFPPVYWLVHHRGYKAKPMNLAS